MEFDHINLTTLEHLNKRLLHGLLAGVLALILGLSAWNLFLGLRFHGERRTYESRIASLDRELEKRRPEKALDEATWRAAFQEGRFLNRLVAIDVFPWPQVLDVVEGAIPDGVALVSLRPEDGFGGLVLEGSAGSVERLTQFQSALEKSPIFAGIALQTMALEGRGAGASGKPGHHNGLSFELRCRFNLPGLFPEEERGALGWTLLKPEA